MGISSDVKVGVCNTLLSLFIHYFSDTKQFSKPTRNISDIVLWLYVGILMAIQLRNTQSPKTYAIATIKDFVIMMVIIWVCGASILT